MGNISIHCTTLNCGGQVPDSVEELLPIFEINNPQSQQVGFAPDMYIIALQEMVSLNAKNVMITNKKKLDMWRAMLTKAMETANERSWGGKTTKEEEFYD